MFTYGFFNSVNGDRSYNADTFNLFFEMDNAEGLGSSQRILMICRGRPPGRPVLQTI